MHFQVRVNGKQSGAIQQRASHLRSIGCQRWQPLHRPHQTLALHGHSRVLVQHGGELLRTVRGQTTQRTERSLQAVATQVYRPLTVNRMQDTP